MSNQQGNSVDGKIPFPEHGKFAKALSGKIARILDYCPPLEIRAEECCFMGDCGACMEDTINKFIQIYFLEKVVEDCNVVQDALGALISSIEDSIKEEKP